MQLNATPKLNDIMQFDATRVIGFNIITHQSVQTLPTNNPPPKLKTSLSVGLHLFCF